jgi:hypothetical protein
VRLPPKLNLDQHRREWKDFTSRFVPKGSNRQRYTLQFDEGFEFYLLEGQPDIPSNVVRIPVTSVMERLVQHNGGTTPSVTVVDELQQEVWATIRHLNLNEFLVQFSVPFSGEIIYSF